MLLLVSTHVLKCAIACVEFHVEGENVLFGVILFSRSVTRRECIFVAHG